MSNLKKWVFSPKFIGVMMTVALLLYVIVGIQKDWWPFGGLPEQVETSDESAVEEAWESSDNQPAPAGPPAGTLTANPTTIQHGQKVTISWDTANVTEVTLEGTDDATVSVDASGTMELQPDKNITYRLKAKAVLDGNAFERSVEVKVIPPLPNPVKDLNDTLTSDIAKRHEPSYRMNLLWDSYCNASVWTELEGSFSSEVMQTEYDGVTRYQKIRELGQQLYEEAKKRYKDLLREWRVDYIPYVTAKGNFTLEETDRCEEPYSNTYRFNPDYNPYG